MPQAHAPGSHVIVVGTFFDQLKKEKDELVTLRNYIYATYRSDRGYPIIDQVCLGVSIRPFRFIEIITIKQIITSQRFIYIKSHKYVKPILLLAFKDFQIPTVIFFVVLILIVNFFDCFQGICIKKLSL